YISDKPAKIIFNCNPSKTLQPYRIINAYNTDTIAKKFKRYVSHEMKRLKRFSDSISGLPKVDSSTFIKNKEIMRELIDRELKFIRDHKENYFSFEIFKFAIASNSFANPYKSLKF